jgi:hypothetical protein
MRLYSARLQRMARQVARQANSSIEQSPVVFFNASTAINRMSLNSAFSLLTAWSLQLTGTPIIRFVCNQGMSRCVLGTDRDDHSKPPPCEICVAHSRLLYSHAPVDKLSYVPDPDLRVALQALDLDQLTTFEWHSIPLGALTLSSLRWVLRRHHLPDNESSRFLFREYILSAQSVAIKFTALIDEVKPQAAVIFNGMFYPEAVARWVAHQHMIRVISHEVGYLPFSAFFTDGEATAYPLEIPEEFELSDQQNARLDDFLQKRFQGNFTMAGIRFWPEMRGLSESFLEHATGFKQIVPVFSNVIFDTSQGHANTVFPHMFAWLDLVLEIMRQNPHTLFVLRAHPDEVRPGKTSRESVQSWAAAKGIDRLSNVIFVKPDEYFSSYELIQRSKFVMVYNSSIGLEAVVMGKPVLSGGKARYTCYPIVFFPQSPEEYYEQATRMLQAEKIEVPEAFTDNARRFLYYQFFRASLPFDEFLEETDQPGFVKLREFSWEKLLPSNSPTFEAIHAGLSQAAPYFLKDDSGI